MTNELVLENLPVQTCPYVDWYRFKQCGISTCKNFTIKTPCHCLDLDRVKIQGSKIISDAELNLYKFSDKKVSTRLVSMKRKEAIDNIKSALVLKEYILFIRNKYEDEMHRHPKATGKYVKRVQKTLPLNIKKLMFKSWMWYRLVDEEAYTEFLKSQNGGDCTGIDIPKILRLTDLKYAKLLKEIEESKA